MEKERKTMMVSTPDEATKPYPIVVRDEVGPLSIVGWPVADLSWSYDEARARGHARWTDITLYAVHNSPGIKYVVQITGRSVVYHSADGSCSQGVSMIVGKIFDDNRKLYEALQPCPACKPKDLDFIDNTDSVKVEVDLPRLYRCRDADEVVSEMHRHSNREGRNRSGLTIKILAAAAMMDKDINQALLAMRRL